MNITVIDYKAALQVTPADKQGLRMHQHSAPRQVVMVNTQENRRTADTNTTFPASDMSPRWGLQLQLHNGTHIPAIS